ncbi:MAG: exodeoxyribonuclease VII small subunit [Acidimicrobiales bacterium]
MTEQEIGYAEALAELEGILDELDGDEVDVDVLGSRVRRAAELLRLCRDRIASARFDVEQVVAELEAETAEEPAPGRDEAGADADEGVATPRP